MNVNFYAGLSVKVFSGAPSADWICSIEHAFVQTVNVGFVMEWKEIGQALRKTATNTIIFVVLMSGSITACTNGLQAKDSPAICDGKMDVAVSSARELFTKQRPDRALDNFDVSAQVKGAEILVSFAPKRIARFGDNPLVIFDCRTRESRYVHGE